MFNNFLRKNYDDSNGWTYAVQLLGSFLLRQLENRYEYRETLDNVVNSFLYKHNVRKNLIF